MEEPTSSPQINEYLEIKYRVMRVVESGGDPTAEDLRRLYSLEAALRQSGVNPEELFHRLGHQTAAPSPPRVEGGPELILRPIDREIQFNRITEIQGEGYPSQIDTTDQTPAGMSRAIERPLILAACGRRVSEENIGGRCDLCRRWDCKNHIFSCYVCHAALCFRHVHFFPAGQQNIPLCPKHFRRAMRRRDMWAEEDGGEKQR